MAKPPPDVPHLQIHSPDARSHRYDVDENPAFSPPSSTHMFQIFDSSEIFNKHPRKFDLLNTQDDSSLKSTSTELVKAGAKTRSKSAAVAPSGEDFQKLLADHKNHPAMGSPSPAKTTDLKPPDETGPRRRVSVAVMQRSSGSQAMPGAQSTLSKTDEDIGSLSKMFRSAFGTGTAKRTGNLPGYLPEEDDTKDIKPPEFQSVPTEDSSDFVPVTITPEPRRLFGFGPQYQPPSETVMVPKNQAQAGGSVPAGGGLLDRVKLAGITAADGPAAAPAAGRQRKFGSSILAPPTGEEMNTWAPFST